jgi:tRNA A37 threonylcarbamoyladenosine dehydratase
MALNPSFQRLALLPGIEAAEALSRTNVVVAGIGGVGSWCAEALVRSGIGGITIIDSDAVCVTNINRQVEATSLTVGRIKTEVLEKRLKEINPACAVTAMAKVFAKSEGGFAGTAATFGIDRADYIIDAIDSLTHKLDLIETAAAAGKPVFSCMGMAQKLDPTRIRSAGIWETEGCPLARLVRQGLRKRGFTGNFIAVYSPEQLPVRDDIPLACGSGNCLCPARNRLDPDAPVEWCGGKKIINGSAVTVTAAAGMALASLVLRDIYRKYAVAEQVLQGQAP